MKIHIIGGSGSGKTYLAENLSKKYGIRHYDLDDLQWDNDADTYGVKRSKEERGELLEEILKEPEWIIEGVYYKWVSEAFAAADVIYVLNVPLYVTKFRIIKRFCKRKLGLERGKKKHWNHFWVCFAGQNNIRKKTWFRFGRCLNRTGRNAYMNKYANIIERWKRGKKDVCK